MFLQQASHTPSIGGFGVKQGTGDLQGGECYEHKPIRVQWGQLEGSLVKGR